MKILILLAQAEIWLESPEHRGIAAIAGMIAIFLYIWLRAWLIKLLAYMYLRKQLMKYRALSESEISILNSISEHMEHGK